LYLQTEDEQEIEQAPTDDEPKLADEMEDAEGTLDVDIVAEKGEASKDRDSIHFGDEDFDPEATDVPTATWGEVCHECCVHSPSEWLLIFVGVCVICGMLYLFLLGLELLSTSAKALTGCAAASLFGDDFNPVAGLIIGMLATVLLQSSSTTTSIIVSLVGSGTIDPQAAIYMVMGANIGTSVTNTIVAIGQ